MKKYLIHLGFGFFLMQTSLIVFADENPKDRVGAENAAAQPVEKTKEANNTLPLKKSNQPLIPKLAIRWACQECDVNEKVAPLIEQSYAAEAAQNGYVVSESEVAEMVITDFRQRPPGVRAMFGVFAGKDRLGVRIVYRGKERNADDYSANAWYGMNSLCESVAKKSYAEILSIIKSE